MSINQRQKIISGVPVYTTSNGFSLLELLVVLVIIGIIISVAVLALTDRTQSQKIQYSAEEFVQIVDLAEEQAILKPSVYGLKITLQGYCFYQIALEQKKYRWNLITNDSLFKCQNWPRAANIKLLINNQNELTTAVPQIMINTSGEITPFTLQISNYQITALANGMVTQQRL